MQARYIKIALLSTVLVSSILAHAEPGAEPEPGQGAGAAAEPELVLVAEPEPELRPVPAKSWRHIVTVNLGPTWAKTGKSETFYLQPAIQKAYISDHKTHSFATGELFVGCEHHIEHRLSSFLGQLGIALTRTSGIGVGGSIWEDADPNFDNYFYSYKVVNTRVALKGKLLKEYHKVVPYVSGSLGVGFNRSGSFQIAPKIDTEVPAPPFAPHTKAQINYTLGVGLEKVLYPDWRVGVGYEFASLGKSNLNRAPGQTMGHGLRLDHLYTNELLLSLTFIV